MTPAQIKELEEVIRILGTVSCADWENDDIKTEAIDLINKVIDDG